MITFIERHEIDDVLWNECIKNAENSSVSAYSWYLDCVCKNWSALVLDNYKAILPLPIKSKFKIKYLLQPLFVKTLNIYSKQQTTVDLVDKFLHVLPDDIKLIDINLLLKVTFKKDDFNIFSKTFQELHLSKPYATIAKGYAASVHRNIRKAEKNNLYIVENIPVKEVVAMYKANVGYKIKQLKAKDYTVLATVMEQVLKHNCGFTVGVMNRDEKLVAAAFFNQSANTLSFFNGSSTPLGKSSAAMCFLFDHIFKTYANQKYVFDFEGSSIKGIADFNKKFGAKDCVYLQIKKNTLPYIVKKLTNQQ